VSEAFQRQVVPQVVAVPQDAQVTNVLRFNPQIVQIYFDNIRNPQSFFRAIEAAGVKLNVWIRSLLEKAWNSIAISSIPVMEVHPVANPSAYIQSFSLEVIMNIRSLKSLFEQTSERCTETFSKLPEMEQTHREHLITVAEDCLSLIEYGVQLTTLLSIFTLEFVHRKMQFSLPVGLMPNSVKAIAGIWTD